ncbi:hypothetical protein QIS74_05616 [Colletotrichum tabaci]|uniref:Uncharacterized protein n=1 Tax=Colletotrichum tabaci TaxID=1209068 RepID=A0AAV9THE2_9PEZI
MSFQATFKYLALALAAAGYAVAEPTRPGLTYLYSLNGTLGEPFTTGAGPHGTRAVLTVLGGPFSGPNISGQVLPIGADWGIVDSNGLFWADARYNLRTDDGAEIFVQTSGPGQPDGTNHLRVIFETGSEKYYWMNNILAIGILTNGTTTDGTRWAALDAWQVNTSA